MDHIHIIDEERSVVCPLCNSKLTDGYLVTGIGEVLWLTKDAVIPSFRIRYTKKSTLPEGVIMIQPTHHGQTSQKTRAMRCQNCGYTVIFDCDRNQ